jgi:hypothetical protein
VRAGHTARVTALLEARLEIINMEGPGGDRYLLVVVGRM